MGDILEEIAYCIVNGRINIHSPFPPKLQGKNGAYELTREALDSGIPPGKVLSDGLVKGMETIGKRFRDNKVFVPEVLMAAKAVSAAMVHLRPYYSSGEVQTKGKLIIGTVLGDLHDIGKNLVAMMVEGSGWEVIDLGTDVPTEKFLTALEENPGAVVGLSALLTTTMANMNSIVSDIKKEYPNTRIIVGGAPLSNDFGKKIGADYYSSDPQGAVEYLNALNNNIK
jgi:methanogenic corrinoid protein MtbC1